MTRPERPIEPAEALRLLLRERGPETAAALTIVRRIASSLDVDVIMGEAVGLATAVAHCPIGAVYLLDEADQRLWIRATSPGYESLIGNYSLEVGAGLTGWTALNRAPTVINEDPHDDPRYVSVPEVDLDFRAALTIPMISPADRLAGVITLHKLAPEVFSPDDLEALEPIAALTAAAVERSQLYTRSRRQIDLVRAVSDLDDPLRSAAAAREALRSLCASARLLLQGTTVALYTRGATSWRLTSSASDARNAPQDEVAPQLLEPLAVSDAPVRLAHAHHRELFEAVAPDAEAARHGVAARLEAGGGVVGMLVCIGSPATPSATERELLGIIAGVSAMIIQGRGIAERLSPRSIELTLLRALSEGSEPPGVVAARAQQLGVDLERPHLAATFQLAAGAEPHAEPDRALGELESNLRARFRGAVAGVHGLELLALFPGGDAGPLIEELGGAIRQLTGDLGAHVNGGLSSGVSHVGDYGRAYAEARDARQIGVAIKGPGHVIAYDNLGAQRHLWALARSSARDPFQERLEVLRRHDAHNGSKLLETVEGYLEEYGHRERASNRLRVHRNTLRQRLERINELCGIDLEDVTTHFDVQTAMSILRFRELQHGANGGHRV